MSHSRDSHVDLVGVNTTYTQPRPSGFLQSQFFTTRSHAFCLACFSGDVGRVFFHHPFEGDQACVVLHFDEMKMPWRLQLLGRGRGETFSPCEVRSECEDLCETWFSEVHRQHGGRSP